MNITAERYALLLNQTTERPTTKHTEKPPTNNYKTLYSSMIQAGSQPVLRLGSRQDGGQSGDI